MTDLEVLIDCTNAMFKSLNIQANYEQTVKIAGWVKLMVDNSNFVLKEKIIQYIKNSTEELDKPAEN